MVLSEIKEPSFNNSYIINTFSKRQSNDKFNLPSKCGSKTAEILKLRDFIFVSIEKLFCLLNLKIFP